MLYLCFIYASSMLHLCLWYGVGMALTGTIESENVKRRVEDECQLDKILRMKVYKKTSEWYVYAVKMDN